MAETKTFACPECAVEFKTQEELDGHNKTIHKQQAGSLPRKWARPRPCRPCPRSSNYLALGL
jgi:hypothetical protein